MLNKIKYVTLAISLILVSSASASLFISADSVSSPDLNDGASGAPNWGTSLINTINQSGLSSPLSTATDATISGITHVVGFGAANQFIDSSKTSGTFEFTFNAAQNLTDIYVWNYTQQDSRDETLKLRAIKDYEIYIDTGSGFGLSAIVSGSLAVADYNNHTSQQIGLGGTQSGVVGIRLVALNNHGGNSIGLDEVAFRAIPEPATLGLVALSAGAILFIRRLVM